MLGPVGSEEPVTEGVPVWLGVAEEEVVAVIAAVWAAEPVALLLGVLV